MRTKEITALFTRILAASAFFCSVAGAQSFDKSAAGTYSATFLKIAVSPRGAAMGEAYSAESRDSSAIDVNPACLMNIKEESIFFSHAQYIAQTSLEYASYSQNMGEDVGAWGIGIKYFNWGKLEQTDEGGGKISDFYPYDLAVNITFASYISGFNKDEEERFVFGGTGKVVRSKIILSNNTISADMGILTPYMFDRKFRMALVAQNIMGALKFEKESYPLPLIMRLGSSIYLSKDFIVTSDLTAPKDSFPYLSVGTELTIEAGKKTKFSLRGGLNTRNLFELKGLKNITAGFGLKHYEYSMDYAFSPFGELGNIHRISISLNY